jgi:hypothetical protein
MNFSRWRTLPEDKIHLDRGLSSAELKTSFWEVRALPVRFVSLYRLLANIELSDFPSMSFSFYQLLYRQATRGGVDRLLALSLVIKLRINRSFPDIKLPFCVLPVTMGLIIQWKQVLYLGASLTSRVPAPMSRSNPHTQLIRIGTRLGVSPSYHGISVRFPTCAVPMSV